MSPPFLDWLCNPCNTLEQYVQQWFCILVYSVFFLYIGPWVPWNFTDRPFKALIFSEYIDQRGRDLISLKFEHAIAKLTVRLKSTSMPWKNQCEMRTKVPRMQPLINELWCGYPNPWWKPGCSLSMELCLGMSFAIPYSKSLDLYNSVQLADNEFKNWWQIEREALAWRDTWRR